MSFELEFPNELSADFADPNMGVEETLAPNSDDFPFKLTVAPLSEDFDPKLNSALEDLGSVVSLLLDIKANPTGLLTFSELGVEEPLPNENDEDLADDSFVPNAGTDAGLGLEFDPKANTELVDFSVAGAPNTKPDEDVSLLFSALPKLNPPVGLGLSLSLSFTAEDPNLNPDVGATEDALEPKDVPNPVPPVSPDLVPKTAGLVPEFPLPNLNPPESPKLALELFDSGCFAPGFGVSQAAHLILSAGFEIIHTSQDQDPGLALNLSNKSSFGSDLFSRDVKEELNGFSSFELLPNENWPKDGLVGSAALPDPNKNGEAESVLLADPNTAALASVLGKSIASGLAKKLKEFVVAGVDEENPPNPAKTFFFSPPSAAFLLRAVLITRPFNSLSLACTKNGYRKLNLIETYAKLGFLATMMMCFTWQLELNKNNIAPLRI